MPLCQFCFHWPQTLDIRGPFHLVFFFFGCLSINVQIHGKRYHFFSSKYISESLKIIGFICKNKKKTANAGVFRAQLIIFDGVCFQKGR